MRILFMGTPDFAVASLKRLVADGHDVCAVFTQPDKPKNRGMKMIAPPVKEYALTENIPVYQPLKMKDGTALALVQSLEPELIVVAAYGRILPEDILNTPKYGAINVHSSILPKYRGAAPINWAILNGDAVTGVSIMYMAPELDAGDVILCRETAIDPDEDAVTLTTRLAELGAEVGSDVPFCVLCGTAMVEGRGERLRKLPDMPECVRSRMSFMIFLTWRSTQTQSLILQITPENICLRIFLLRKEKVRLKKRRSISNFMML